MSDCVEGPLEIHGINLMCAEYFQQLYTTHKQIRGWAILLFTTWAKRLGWKGATMCRVLGLCTDVQLEPSELFLHSCLGISIQDYPNLSEFWYSWTSTEKHLGSRSLYPESPMAFMQPSQPQEPVLPTKENGEVQTAAHQSWFIPKAPSKTGSLWRNFSLSK